MKIGSLQLISIRRRLYSSIVGEVLDSIFDGADSDKVDVPNVLEYQHVRAFVYLVAVVFQ